MSGFGDSSLSEEMKGRDTRIFPPFLIFGILNLGSPNDEVDAADKESTHLLRFIHDGSYAFRSGDEARVAIWSSAERGGEATGLTIVEDFREDFLISEFFFSSEVDPGKGSIALEMSDFFLGIWKNGIAVK